MSLLEIEILSNSKENSHLLDQLISNILSETKRFVRKQGEIADQIGKLLKTKEITQKELAQKIGMKESQMSKILAGNANCTLKTITKIENALNENIITVPIFGMDIDQDVITDTAIESLLDKKFKVRKFSLGEEVRVDGDRIYAGK